MSRTQGEKALLDLMPSRERNTRVIKVPDIKHDTLCWKQKLDPPHAMTRCTYDKGHEGPHSWENL